MKLYCMMYIVGCMFYNECLRLYVVGYILYAVCYHQIKECYVHLCTIIQSAVHVEMQSTYRLPSRQALECTPSPLKKLVVKLKFLVWLTSVPKIISSTGMLFSYLHKKTKTCFYHNNNVLLRITTFLLYSTVIRLYVNPLRFNLHIYIY